MTSLLAALGMNIPTVWLVLWLGMACLTGTLLALMWTRWGQSQPLRKCVVLSLFAHFLMAIYATTIQVATVIPRSNPAEIMQVALVSDESDPPHDADEGGPHRPWERLGGEVEMDRPTPERIDDTYSVTVEKEAPSDVEMDVFDEALESQIGHTAVLEVLPNWQTELSHAGERAAKAVEIEEPSEPAANQNDTRLGPTSPTLPKNTHSESESELLRTEDPAEIFSVSSLLADMPEINGSGKRLPVETTSPTALDTFDVPGGPSPAPLDEKVPNIGNVSDVARDGDNRITGPELPLAPRRTSAAANGPISPQEKIESSGERISIQVEVNENHTRKIDEVPSLDVPLLYQNRVAPERREIVEQHGGSAETEQAVDLALAWLAANQGPDGRWDADLHGGGREMRVAGQDRQGAGSKADTGITGLALLAFLGAGHSHQSDRYSVQIQRGLNYLIRSQGGNGDFGIGAGTFASMYCHGIATLAVGEAYALTRDAHLRGPLERAVRFTIAAQDPVSGGWRYLPGDRGDTSQLGWQLMALKSSEQSGIKIPDATWTRAKWFVKSVSHGRQGGLASYRPGERTSKAMTAEALVCRFFLREQRPFDPAVIEAADYLREELPGMGINNLYYWYYGTLGLYQAQGANWENWNEALKKTLLASQIREGYLAGSWDTNDRWGGYGGRVYTTAMAAMCLEVYYRYLPLYSLDIIAGRPTQTRTR